MLMLLFARVFFRVCFNPRNSKNNNDILHCLDLKKFKNKKKKTKTKTKTLRNLFIIGKRGQTVECQTAKN